MDALSSSVISFFFGRNSFNALKPFSPFPVSLLQSGGFQFAATLLNLLLVALLFCFYRLASLSLNSTLCSTNNSISSATYSLTSGFILLSIIFIGYCNNSSLKRSSSSSTCTLRYNPLISCSLLTSLPISC